MDIIQKYFPGLTNSQKRHFSQLLPLYIEWNAKINVVSRRDINLLYERHVLHSLGIAKIIQFRNGSKIVDIGTGGGFPGLPLAIMFPEVQFHLVDSIRKKIRVIEEIVADLGLNNISLEINRAESMTGQFDFVVSRAVTALPVFEGWVKHLISPKQQNALPNGILYLKGGDFSDELDAVRMNVRVYRLDGIFEEDFFATKSIIHLY